MKRHWQRTMNESPYWDESRAREGYALITPEVTRGIPDAIIALRKGITVQSVRERRRLAIHLRGQRHRRLLMLAALYCAREHVPLRDVLPLRAKRPRSVVVVSITEDDML